MMLTPNGPTKHVYFAGSRGDGSFDAHFHKFWWDGNWHYNDLTSATHNAPVAIFPAFGYEYSFGGTISPLAVTAVPLGLLGSTVPSDSRGRTTAIRATS